MTVGVVLLVDDDPKVLRLLEATLRLKDLDVVKAETSAEALGWLKNNRPALMISDTEMPDLDGFDLFRRIRGLAHLADVPFIFLSARSEPEDIVRGLALGADEYLRKPFAVDELLARVLRVLAEKDPDSEPPPRAEFSGSLDRTALPDVLRVLADHRRTGLLRVDPAGLAVSGFIQVDGGRATHSEFGLLDGVAALLALLAHPEGQFAFDASERLDGQSIHVPTLPLLMEGYRLLDAGLLRRVDPRRVEAAGTLRALLKEHARLPDPDDEDGGEFGETQIIQLGAGTMELELDDDFLERSIADEVIGSDTVEFAPGFDDEELEAIQVASVPTRRQVGPTARGSVPFAPVPLRPLRAVPSERELAPTERLRAPSEALSGPFLGQIMVVGDADPDESDRSLSGDEYGVALVDDTIAELDVNALLDPAGSARGDGLNVMAFFERLKLTATDELGVDAVQLGTRSGRVIASNIAEVTRRDTVAAFSAQAMQFASRDPDGTQFASLDAGDLHVLVVEVDHVRVLTLLFGRRPDPAAALRILRPHLEEYRGSR